VKATGAFSEERLKRIPRVMQQYVDRGEIAGAVTLVSRRGEVHVATVGVMDLESREPMRRDTIFRIASMTKPLTAVAAMMLIEETTLRLDDPVDKYLPELANRRVLRTIRSAIDDTVPAKRAITVRDLLTFRAGFGVLFDPPGTYPIQKAMADAGITFGPTPPALSTDEWLRRFATLPLMDQPGEHWKYNTSAEILAALIARVSDKSFDEFLRERIIAPLGMSDTAFSVPEEKLPRLASVYDFDEKTKRLAPHDDGVAGAHRRHVVSPSGATGLASTVDDMLAFGRMLLNFGSFDGGRLLARPTVQFMTSDQISAEVKTASPFSPGFWDDRGWGLGLSVITTRDRIDAVPGRFGWDGGLQTSWYSDPAEDLVGILMTQRFANPLVSPVVADFWTSLYQSLGD
jgi:CubicO group peptidase (beta-lactamase class C family)